MKNSKKLLMIPLFIIGLLVGYILFSSNSSKSISLPSLPPYRFTLIEDFSLQATGVWSTNEPRDISGVNADSLSAISIECELYNNICYELNGTFVIDGNQTYLYAPYIISYDIESKSNDRIVARRDGGAAVITLDISLLSETVQKERIEKEGKLTKYSLVSGLK